MAKYSKMTLIWVPAHKDIEGNYIADEMASKGITIENLQENDTIGMPIATLRLFIKQKTLRRLRNRQTDIFFLSLILSGTKCINNACSPLYTVPGY